MTTDYDVIAIGGGSAGLAAAGIAVHIGARTLLIERDRLGGDCTWTGCIPSKTLLHAASVAQTVRTADRLGITCGSMDIDFARVMENLRETRLQVYDEADRPEIYRAMGVDVRFGSATFVDPNTLTVSDGASETNVTGRYIIICTGSSPAVPPVAGLDQVEYITTESLFDLEERPAHLIILGGGPVGIEMAQAFRRLGSEVTVLESGSRILTNDEPELADLLRLRLESEGVRFILRAEVRRIGQNSLHRRDVNGRGERNNSIRDGGASESGGTEISGNERRGGEQGYPDAGVGEGGGRDAYPLSVDLRGHAPIHGSALLVATDRRPNVEGLGLAAAGIDLSSNGIQVDEYCRTSAKNVFAAGDVTGRYQFTHMSEHMARKAVMNALLKVRQKIDSANVPWVTYTDPELAHVGATEAELNDAGSSYETHRFPYARLDRATTDARSTGAVLIYATKWRGRILGASVLGARAGELIGELAVAMRAGVSLRQISDTIHPYPSYGLGVRRAADQWYARRYSPTPIHALKTVFGYRGHTPDIAPDEII